MDNVLRVACDLALLEGEEFNRMHAAILDREMLRLVKLGLERDEARICARAIVQAALGECVSLENEEGSFKRGKITDLGIVAH